MSLTEIQKAVESLPSDERKRLAAWIIARYPVLNVADLMSHAQRMVDSGEWQPAPPSHDNIPKGRALSHALETAKGLGLGR